MNIEDIAEEVEALRHYIFAIGFDEGTEIYQRVEGIKKMLKAAAHLV